MILKSDCVTKRGGVTLASMQLNHGGHASPLHELKIQPKQFQEVMSGKKRTEIRRCDDRTFVAGDVLRLWEWDPKSKKYTGAALFVDVTHVDLIQDVVKLYKDFPSVPLAILSLGARQVIQKGSMNPPSQ